MTAGVLDACVLPDSQHHVTITQSWKASSSLFGVLLITMSGPSGGLAVLGCLKRERHIYQGSQSELNICQGSCSQGNLHCSTLILSSCPTVHMIAEH